MRRRSFNLRRFLGGVIVVVATIVIFTRVFMPLERFFIDRASTILSWYAGIATSMWASVSLPPDGTRIIGRRFDEYQNIFFVNQSLSEGTKIISGNVFVGIVRTQGANASKVEAISSPFFRSQGIFERSGLSFELEGKGAGLLETKVPRGVSIENGEAIWYDEGRLLLLGRVAKVIDVPSDPFLTVLVLQPVNITTLWSVEISP